MNENSADSLYKPSAVIAPREEVTKNKMHKAYTGRMSTTRLSTSFSSATKKVAIDFLNL